MKMYTKLIGFRYKIVYKHGSSNAAADALSRHPSLSAQVNVISSASPTWLSEVLAGYSSNPASIRLLEELTVDPQSHPPFSLSSSIICYHSCIWIGDNKPLQLRIMPALHNSALGGHSGFPMTHSHVRKLFAWRGLKSVVRLHLVLFVLKPRQTGQNAPVYCLHYQFLRKHGKSYPWISLMACRRRVQQTI